LFRPCGGGTNHVEALSLALELLAQRRFRTGRRCMRCGAMKGGMRNMALAEVDNDFPIHLVTLLVAHGDEQVQLMRAVCGCVPMQLAGYGVHMYPGRQGTAVRLRHPDDARVGADPWSKRKRERAPRRGSMMHGSDRQVEWRRDRFRRRQRLCTDLC